MILIGAWFGSDAPEFTTFLYPIGKSLLRLSTDGLKVSISGIHETVKIFTLTATMDNPARDKFLNKAGHGSTLGCTCNQLGETYANAAGRETIVGFPYCQASDEDEMT